MNIIVKIKMEKDKKLKQKRLRLKPSHRWTEAQSLQLFQAVSDAIKDSPESFEKSKIYEKLQQNTPALQSILCVAMKSKMRYLKASYVAAAAWKNETNGDESSVSAHVNKTFPNFDLLEVIFGQRKNVNPGVIFQSTDSIEVLTDSPCADSSLNDTIVSYDLCALDCEDLVDPILPISSDCGNFYTKKFVGL